MTTNLVSKLELQSLKLVETIDHDAFLSSIVRGECSATDYVWFLEFTYHYLRWSGVLLARTAHGLRNNPRYAWLLPFIEAKAAEESTHDQWVLNDLGQLGADTQRLQSGAPPTAVCAYVHFCSTMAEQGSPAFLGIAYGLEFISMRRAKIAADNLRARSTIPKIQGALSFLEGHGEADPGHVHQLSLLLTGISEEPDQHAILLASSVLNTLYPRFFSPSSLEQRQVPSPIARYAGAVLALERPNARF